MKTIIKNFIDIKTKINKKFDCNEDFFLNPLITNKWIVKDNEGIFFLTYWDKDNNPKDCVVSKKDNQPMIYEKDGFTMIVAIECVKIAFILDNKNKL